RGGALDHESVDWWITGWAPLRHGGVQSPFTEHTPCAYLRGCFARIWNRTADGNGRFRSPFASRILRSRRTNDVERMATPPRVFIGDGHDAEEPAYFVEMACDDAEGEPSP
ncbi:MAG: hypothetical protein JW751_26860, partial [Polyangiaceae bacterium]|nr:hypothetical protein [Polyangiaceae bacterium]